MSPQLKEGTENDRQTDTPAHQPSPPLDPPAHQPSKPLDPPAHHSPSCDILYGLEDTPPWFLSLLYSFQHYLSMVGGTISIPLLLSSALCMEESNPGRGALVSSIIFVSGIITIMQATVGVRLPIVQGGNFAYLIPSFVLLKSAFPPCPALPHDPANHNTTDAGVELLTEAGWQERLLYVQGGIALSSLIQVFLGFAGLIGMILRFITPLTVVPTVTLVGLALFDVAAEDAAQHWPICILTMLLITLFSQHLREVNIPCPAYTRKKGFYKVLCRPFQTLSFLIATLISWFVCWVLTISDVLPATSPARTDAAGDIIQNTQWFRIPYPGQFGVPTVSVAGTVGMISCIFASIIESVGDYYACARVVGAKMPPEHAINRGIGVEGLGCLLAGLIGTGSGSTSYSGNIGILAITKVGSRRMIQLSGFVMMVSGVIAKMGALFVTIPGPVIAGVFIIKFAMVTAVGISTLQYVDLKSPRNIFVMGFSIFFGISFSKWIQAHPNTIATGTLLLNQTLTVLLQTPMFVGGMLGLILDNTIPGTDEERGVLQWQNFEEQTTPHEGEHSEAEHSFSSSVSLQGSSSYDLPFGMKWIRRASWTRYLPFSPTYRGFSRKRSESTSGILSRVC